MTAKRLAIPLKRITKTRKHEIERLNQRMLFSCFRAFVISYLYLVFTAVPALAGPQDEARQKAFERVFGDKALFNPETVARVKALKPGERLFLDTNGDGKKDECWFIDIATRHQDKTKPILVRAIDEDGDLEATGGPDLDSDLYLADWRADGTVDSAIDYQDDDGDGDVDEMGTFFFQAKNPYLNKDALCVWWAWDIGDDNLLWYDVNYTYQQPDCQWRTHFGGDEMLCAMVFDADAARWLPVYESPFAFYDTDHDGESEVVVRISGKAGQIESLRYSFDADNRSSHAVPHHYDFSLTALAPGATVGTPNFIPGKSDLWIPPQQVTDATVRGFPTAPFPAWASARQFANETKWARVLLTWDENDLNTDNAWEKDPHLRWEGVIAHPSKDFPQIGGPTCGPFNKRNEIDLAPTGPMRLYYDAADRRIHLRGADQAWIDVDFDMDRKTDMRYTWRDADGDDILETREIDTDADGKPDLTLTRQKPEVQDLPLNQPEMTALYRPALAFALAENQELIDLMKRVLSAKGKSFAPDPAEQFYTEKLPDFLPQARIGERMRASPTTARYYQDIVRDRYCVRIEKLLPADRLDAFHRAYANGNLPHAARLLRQVFPDVLPPSAGRAGRDLPSGLLGSVEIRLHNPQDLLRESDLIVIPLDQIRKIDPEFDPATCELVDSQRWLDWRPIPFQVDNAGPAERSELCFQASMEGGTTKTFLLNRVPKVRRPKFPIRTGWAQDWVPPNIGWESNRIAYRAYWGQFDFFGKKVDRLIYDTIASRSYHDETDWGIDALNVAKTSGLGGVTLYVGDRAYLAQNPAGEGTCEFTKRMLATGPVRTVIEFTADKVGPYKVQFRCTAIADRQETQISILVTGPATTERVYIAPGFIKLDQDEKIILDTSAGVFAAWGRQTTTIGTIGMGLVFNPAAFAGVVDTPAERRIKLRAQVGKEMTYLLKADWLEGRTFPRCPTIDNWHHELRDQAVRFGYPIEVKVVPAANPD